MDKHEFISKLKQQNIEFNENQLKLITTTDKPVVGIACAGSGKTTSMLGSILYLTEVKKVDPSRILVLTFSKSAVEDIKLRYKKLTLSLDIDNRVEFRTFHSLFYSLLRIYMRQKLDILDEKKKYSMIASYLRQMNIIYNEEVIEKIASLLSYRINNCLTEEEFLNSPKFILEGIDRETYRHISELYTKDKLLMEKVDYDDLQLLTYNLLKSREDIRQHARGLWDYFIIDEFQDISKIQIHIMNLIIAPENHKNVKVVGDDDQAIYGWRGSDNRYILGFDRIFQGAEKIYIDTNYRCPLNILDLAKEVINNNTMRFKKEIQAHNKGGNLYTIKANTLKEISYKTLQEIEKLLQEGIKPQDIAVLYRDHTSNLYLIDWLLRKNIPVNLKNTKGLIYNNRITKEIMEVIYFLLEPNTEENFVKALPKLIPYYTKQQATKDSKRLVQTGWEGAVSCSSYTQDKAITRIAVMMMSKAKSVLAIAKDMMCYRLNFIADKLGYTSEELDEMFEYLMSVAENMSLKEFKEEIEYYSEKANIAIATEQKGINFLTMHSAKGLEFNSVFIMNISKGRFPNSTILNKISQVYEDKELQKVIEEERRLLYVAITRAKENLYITYTKSPTIFIEEVITKTGKYRDYFS